jgi:hypothetical protein
MSKAESALLRATMVRTADTARKQDPQLARIYYLQMTERGKDHLGALCVVAACLAERAWTVMRRGTPYLIRGTDGQLVNAGQAKAVIAANWAVYPEIRARRRSKKTGKAPRKSSKDSTHGAASPAALLHLTANCPSSRPLDNRSPHRESELDAGAVT